MIRRDSEQSAVQSGGGVKPKRCTDIHRRNAGRALLQLIDVGMGPQSYLTFWAVVDPASSVIDSLRMAFLFPISRACLPEEWTLSFNIQCEGASELRETLRII